MLGGPTLSKKRAPFSHYTMATSTSSVPFFASGDHLTNLAKKIIQNVDNRLPGAIAPCLIGVEEELFERKLITFEMKRKLKGPKIKKEKADTLVDDLIQLHYIGKKFESFCDGLQAGAQGERTLERIAKTMKDQLKANKVFPQPSRTRYQEIFKTFDRYIIQLPGVMAYQIDPIVEELQSKGVIGWELAHEIKHGEGQGKFERAEHLINELDGLLYCDDDPKEFLITICHGLIAAAGGQIGLTYVAKNLKQNIERLTIYM